MPKIIILRGIPLSGKSTFAGEMKEQGYTIISKDKIRDLLLGKDRKFSWENEKKVDYFQKYLLETEFTLNSNIVVDNTHLNGKTFRRVLAIIPSHYQIEVKLFKISLNKAYWRNITRYIKTGRWIPFKVIKQFKEKSDNLGI